MKVLKWFEKNLCSNNEEFSCESASKLVSGYELITYLNKLNEMMWYNGKRQVNSYNMVDDSIMFGDNFTYIYPYTNDYYKIRMRKSKDGKEWSLEEDGIRALYWNHVPHGYLGKPKKNRSSYYTMKYKPVKNTNIIYKLLLKHSFNQNELCQLIKEINQYNSKNCWYTMDFIQWSIPGKFFIGGKEYNEIKLNFSWDLFSRRDKCNFIAQTKNNTNEFSIGNSKWHVKHAQFEMVKGGWYYLA